MRKFGIVILVIVVLLVAAALIVPHLVDINQYHGQIQAQLEKRLGRQVSLGDMKLSLFPPSFQVENATIAEDPHIASSRPFATAQKLAVSVKLWPLLHKEVDVKSLELDRPHVELVRDAKKLLHSLLRPRCQQPRQGRKANSLPGSSRWQISRSTMARLRSQICRSTSRVPFTITLIST